MVLCYFYLIRPCQYNRWDRWVRVPIFNRSAIQPTVIVVSRRKRWPCTPVYQPSPPAVNTID